MKRKISSLDEIDVVRDFLETAGLQLKGLRRAVGQRIVHGYPKDAIVVEFREGDDPAIIVKAGRVDLSNIDALKSALREVELPKPMAFDGTFIVASGMVIDGLLFKPESWMSPQVKDGKQFTAIFDSNVHIAVIEERQERADAHKLCFRWTYYDDGKWRQAEPEKLPLWGMEQFAEGGGSTRVVLHEGPKAARRGRMLSIDYRPTYDVKEWVDSHPWRDELKYATHLGWIGGVHALDRVDLSVLRKFGVQEVVIIPDNDDVGRGAIQDIARRLAGTSVLAIDTYPQNFPAGWDMADPMPGGVGPLKDLLRDFSWVNTSYQVTQQNGSPKTVYVPVESEPKGWYFVNNIKRFVVEGRPEVAYAKDDLPLALAYRSDAGFRARIGATISERPHQTVDSWGFYPNQGKVVRDEGLKYLNNWIDPEIKPAEMNDDARQLWIEFWNYHLPDATERALVQRWVATQIAHPERRHCGLVTFSTTQGTGKTMVFERILQPLVGHRNCSQPRPSDFTNKFNDFMMNSALVYADELIAQRGQGDSSAYNTAKEFVTSEYITIEPKGLARFKIRNCAAIYITTNSDRPLYMETSDRRWIIAHANEMKMPADLVRRMIEFTGSREGLRMIRWWAEEFESCGLGGELSADLGAGFPTAAAYIPFGADAPLTDAKADMLELSTPVAMRMADDLLGLMGSDERGEPRMVAVLDEYLIRSVNDTFDENSRAAHLDRRMLKKHWAKTGWFRAEVSKKRPKPENGVYLPSEFTDADSGDQKKKIRSECCILLSRPLAIELVERGAIEIMSAESGIYKFSSVKKFRELKEVIGELSSAAWREGTAWHDLGADNRVVETVDRQVENDD